ncbi:MAG TPA: c-type cytochrome, partial [Chthoniobacteraceae bacterium]|nr:c-type cytochrome [Chthoniobacteraceae bacterium]
DRWFRPVDTKVGPDGAIYMADWYDSRLSHVDPRDTWDKDHGRIYRLRATETPVSGRVGVSPAGFGVSPKPSDVEGAANATRRPDGSGRMPEPAGGTPTLPGGNHYNFDLATLSNDELIETLKNPNKWYRQTALRIFYDRADASIAPKLKKLVDEKTGQFALECFWALNASGGFNDEVALQALEHKDEFVRYWTVRLLGDRYAPARYSSSTRAPAPLPAAIQKKLEALARTEAEAQVRAQLASCAKRLPGANALPILREALYRDEDANDKHIPLLLWWALESKAVSDRAQILAMLKESSLWQTPLFGKFIVARLGQRFTAERTDENLETAAQLLSMAPSPEAVDELVKGMEAGLQGDRVARVPAALQKQVSDAWSKRPHTPVLVSFAMRLDHPAAAEAAVQTLADKKTSAAERKSLLELLSERRIEAAVPIITSLLKNEKNDAAKTDLLNALAHFNAPEVGQTILELLPNLSTKVRAAAINALSSRADWARAMLDLVDRGQLKKEQVAVSNLLSIQKFGDPQCDALVKKNWGSLRASSEEKEQLIKNLRVTLARAGDAAKGHDLFKATCAVCHTLKGEGAKIGPDLTGYERDNLDFMLPAIVDPSLGIREEYTLYNLTKKDGQVLAGFVNET